MAGDTASLVAAPAVHLIKEVQAALNYEQIGVTPLLGPSNTPAKSSSRYPCSLASLTANMESQQTTRHEQAEQQPAGVLKPAYWASSRPPPASPFPCL